jgi:hypothetical protein
MVEGKCFDMEEEFNSQHAGAVHRSGSPKCLDLGYIFKMRQRVFWVTFSMRQRGLLTRCP